MSVQQIILEILRFNHEGRDLPAQTLTFLKEANVEDREIQRAIEQLYRKYVTMDYRQALEKERTV